MKIEFVDNKFIITNSLDFEELKRFLPLQAETAKIDLGGSGSVAVIAQYSIQDGKLYALTCDVAYVSNYTWFQYAVAERAWLECSDPTNPDNKDF